MKHPHAPSPVSRRVRHILASCALFLALLGPSALHAAVPQLVSYQGRVAVGTTNFNGPGQFKFALVNTNGTTVYWSNSVDTTPADGVPDTAVTLTVTNGLYSVLLGDTSIANMAVIPATVWVNADVRLRIWFNDGTNGFQLLTPDQRIAPNGYLPDGSVSAAAIAPGAVTNTQLGSGLTLGGITIGTFSGSGAALTNLSGGNLTALSVPLGALAVGSVDSSKILDNTILNADINAAAGITYGKLNLAGSIVNNDIAAGAAILDTKLATIATAGKVANTATTATSANTATTIVLRDASGNFSAGTITGNLIGNATTSATAISFTGALAGNVTGTQGATVVSTVGGVTAANVASGANLANAATNLNTASTIVRRDASGNFSAGTISGIFSGNGAALTNLNAANITGSLTPPANGFAVGGSQLVAGNGGVGVGTASPNVAFEIYRNGPAGPTLRLSSSGNFGTKVGIDLAPYDPVGIGGGAESPARIEASDDNYSAGISFLTKTPGAFANLLQPRLVIRNDGVVSTPGGFIIENRNQQQGDPPAETGRIWLRTDVP